MRAAATRADRLAGAFGRDACWHVCRGGRQATADYLLDRGADVNWVGYDGKTPYDAAQRAATTRSFTG